ncbi:DUF3883 domain-containing protein [Pseudomonadota bacterium]|nr:DUF3883 domain-containing protein [Pseudomonadota bacterium]
MNKLTMPKHSADPVELSSVLEVYGVASGWLDNKDYIERIKKKLNTSQEPQAYTKKTQIHTYFGFLEWHDPNDRRSPKKISESGKQMLKALTNQNKYKMFEIVLSSLENRLFGKDVPGLSSNSYIEVPKLFVCASLELGYLTLNEFGFLLDHVTIKNLNKLLEKIRENRESKNISFDISNKSSDTKPIRAMEVWGFLQPLENTSRRKRLSINPDFVDDFYERLDALRPFNNSKKPILKKPKDQQSNKEFKSSFDYEIPEYSPKPQKKKSKTNKQPKNSKNNSRNNSAANAASKRETGIAGEDYVYDFEVDYLKRNGRKDLAKLVVKQCEDKSSFPGYDIKSFNLDGEEIYIEVKSSASLKKDNFEISSNEFNAAKRYRDKYFIYRVVNAKVDPRISKKIRDPWEHYQNNVLDIVVLTYKMTLHDD